MASLYASMAIEEEDCEDCDDEYRKEIVEEDNNVEDISHSWITFPKWSSMDTVKRMGFEVGSISGSVIFLLLTAVYAPDFILLYMGFVLVGAAGVCGMFGLVKNNRRFHIVAASLAVLAFLDFAAVLAFSVASYFLTNVVMSTYHSQVWEHTNKFGFVFLGILFLVWIATCVTLLVKHSLHSIDNNEDSKPIKLEDATELVQDSSV